MIKTLKKLHNNYLSFRLPFRIAISFLVLMIILVLTQNIQIFPGAVIGLFNSTERDPNTLPKGVESIFIETADKEKLELWRIKINNDKKFAIIFHGNGLDIANFYPYQEYFKEIGVNNYSFDYRGYGKSTGWPSERGLYLDAEAVIEYVLKKENIRPEDLVIVGISIGSGPATYAAEKYNVGTLLFFAPFISMQEAIKDQIGFGFLHPFSFYDFPNLERVKNLNNTCLIVAHGRKDYVLPYRHGEAMYAAHPDKGKAQLILSDAAGHNDILWRASKSIQRALAKCFTT